MTRRYKTERGSGGSWGVYDYERRRWAALYWGRGARRHARRRRRELAAA